MDHRDLLNQAKRQQRLKLQESTQLSNQLKTTLNSIVKSNLTNSNNGCSIVLDKITTIHQLDDKIDKQLNYDISVNFEKMIYQKHQLEKQLQKCDDKLDKETKNYKVIDNLQARSELIDQDLRILENCLHNVKQNRT